MASKTILICITVKYITILKWLTEDNHIEYGNLRFSVIKTSDFNHTVISSHLLCFDVL